MDVPTVDSGMRGVKGRMVVRFEVERYKLDQSTEMMRWRDGKMVRKVR